MNQIEQKSNLPKPPRPWLTLIAGGILLLSGIVIGAGGTALLVNKGLEEPDQAPAHFSKRLAQRMTRDLGLTQQQEEDIHEIFQTHQQELHSVRDSFEQQVNQSFETMQQEVETILTPEQAELWSKRVRQFNSRGERRSPRHDGPPPPPDGRRHTDDDRYREEFRRDQFDGQRDGRIRDGNRRPPRRFEDDAFRDDQSDHQPPPPPQ